MCNGDLSLNHPKPIYGVPRAQRVGFPDSSVGKESACNAGNPGSIPGLGRSTGEGIGHPLQYPWENPPTMQET